MRDDDESDAFERACVTAAIETLRARARRRREDDAAAPVRALDDDACREIVRDVRAKRRRTVRADAMWEDASSDDGYGSMDEAETERVLLAMQDALERELVAEARARAERAEIEDEEEGERLARAIESFERWRFGGDGEGGVGEDEDEEVLCPACGARRVLQNRHVLFCACGKFKIARANEGVGLRYLKRRLAETFDSHVARGCGKAGELRFDVRDEYGLDACVATCGGCDFFEIVM